MKAIIKRELKNYLKNPVLWIGLALMVFQLYQILNPYLQIHYFQTEKELQEVEPDNKSDVDIMEGYVLSTKEEQADLAYGRIKKAMVKQLDMTEEEAAVILDEMRQKNMSVNALEEELVEKYDFHSKYGVKYYFETSEYHKADVKEANAYIKENLKGHTFSYYFAKKFSDFCGLFLSFFSTILLAFLFIRDTRKDTYELLHTKPMSPAGYVGGKIGGGFLAMCAVWGVLVIVFGGLCEFYGRRAGFPVSIWDFLKTASVYILPNILMITCIYAAVALIFKNPLPAVPLLFLYIMYSNMGSIGPGGEYGYFGRPLAILVRFPGKFFDTSPPPLALLNQSALLLAAVLIMVITSTIWKRRRVY